MTLVSKEQRADELLDKTIPELEDGGDGEKLVAAYRELLELSAELVEKHNRYSWEGVPDECRARLYTLEVMKSRSPPEQVSGASDVSTPTDQDSVQVVDEDEYDSSDALSHEDNSTDHDRPTSSEQSAAPTEHDHSNLYEIIDEDVTFDDVVGLDEAKLEFNEKVKSSFFEKEDLEKFALEPPCGALLRGPPGTGKTMISVATANEVDATVLKIKGSDMVSKYVGEPQQNVDKLFDAALDLQPCIIVFDEIDALLTERGQTKNPTGHDQMVAQFLANMSEISYDDDVFLVGTTNKHDELDEAVTRPGRLGEEIYVGLPGKAARRELLQQVLEPAATDLSENIIEGVVEVTRGYSFADIEHIKHNAGWLAKREGAEFITDQHLVSAFRNASPSPNQERWDLPEE